MGAHGRSAAAAPVHAVRRVELSAARLARLTARVDAALEATAPPARTGRADGRPARRVPIVALLAIVLLASAWIVGGGGHRVGLGPARPSALGAAGLADRADGRLEPGLAEGYAHLRIVEQGAGARRRVVERWLAADGTGRLVRTTLAPDGTAGSPEARRTGIGTLTMGGLTPAQVRALPDDPELAFVRLQGDVGLDGPDRSYVGTVVELLAWPGVPARTRGTLFRILDQLGYRSEATADPGLITLVGAGPGPDDTTSVTIDLATTRPTRLATRGERAAAATDPGPGSVVTFAEATLTRTDR